MQRNDATLTRFAPSGRIPTTPHLQSAAVLDYDALLVSAGEDDRLMHELVTLFVAECPRLMARIRDAIAAEDSTQLHAAADALKGSATTIAAVRVADATRVLERMGANNRLTGAPRALASLEFEVRCLELVLSIMKV